MMLHCVFTMNRARNNKYFFIQIYLRITRERKEEERDVYTMICTIEKVVSLQPIICGVINKLG